MKRLSALAWLLCACNSTGVGNPPAPAAMTLALVRDDELEPNPMTSAGAGGEGGAAQPDPSLPQASIRNAIVVLGALRFLPCDAQDGVTELTGPFVVDLAQGRTEPEVPSVEVPESGFCGLDAPLSPAREPAGLLGRSLLFDGTRADGTPFLVFANVNATLRVRAPEGVSWRGGVSEDRSVFWALRPRRWLEPGELDQADATELPDGSHVIVIDIDRHPLLFRLLRMRLASRSTLYEDVNGDHVFDAEDRPGILGGGLEDTD
jgi:hypothetical protein